MSKEAVMDDYVSSEPDLDAGDRLTGPVPS